MKRTVCLILVLLTLVGVTSCGDSKSSPFDHPEKYVSLPELSTVTVKNGDVEESFSEVMKDLLDNMTGEHYTPVTDRDAKVQKGDKVYVSYTGAPKDPSVTLSETAQSAINATESDMISIIPGSQELPEAIENILIGASVDSDISVTVTYTEDNTDIPDLIGKEIVLNIRIHSIARLTITEKHAVKLQYTASLADQSEPLDTILILLKGAVETTDLADKEDTFNEAFSSSELLPHVVGHHKYDTISFTLTLDAERAAKYGYDKAIDIAFEATVMEAIETPTRLTDFMVKELTGGQQTTVAEYENYCRNMVKEQLALRAVANAATYNDNYPEDLYLEFYEENYSEALYEYAGPTDSFTTEELAALLTEEILGKIEKAAKESTISELRERFLFEALFDLFDLSLSEEEYNKELNELYQLYKTEYYLVLLHSGVSNLSDFESLLGKDYLEVQFLYEKLPPLLKEQVQFID